MNGNARVFIGGMEVYMAVCLGCIWLVNDGKTARKACESWNCM